MSFVVTADPYFIAPHCTFDRCQAGGVILPGAPRVGPPWPNGRPVYHPGCWAAEQRRMERP